MSGNDTMASGNFEPEETQVVRKLLQEVDIFVNVGANIGYYCCHSLSMGKPVIAVEPIFLNLNYLLRNITENGWEQNVEIFPVALGVKAGILKMWGGGTGASLIKGWAGVSDSYVTHVPVLTLDRVLGDSLQGKKALILVDVEGAEHMVLKGASKTLCSTPRPIWMIEITTTEHQPKGVSMNPHLLQIFEIFFELGYTARIACLNQKVITYDDIHAVVKGYKKFETHNFIFS